MTSGIFTPDGAELSVGEFPTPHPNISNKQSTAKLVEKFMKFDFRDNAVQQFDYYPFYLGRR